MKRISKSILIQASCEEVFSYASDYRKWKDWFVGVSNVRPTTEKTTGNGARYAYKVRMMMFPVGVETEISDFVINKGWKGKATKGTPHQTQWIFETVESGTNFTYVLDYDIPVPILGSLLDRLILRPQWNKIVENSLRNLKHNFQSK